MAWLLLAFSVGLYVLSLVDNDRAPVSGRWLSFVQRQYVLGGCGLVLVLLLILSLF
jgi:hypothetical protein